MGQRAVGILYGCEAPDLLVTDDDPEPLYGLVQRWEKAARIDWLSKKPKVCVENEGGTTLLGAWVAQGGCAEDGVPYFLKKCLLLADVPWAFRSQVKKASLLWKRFAAHVAKKEKIKLPAPALWLTPCETA